MYRNDVPGSAVSTVGHVLHGAGTLMNVCPARYLCRMTPQQLDLLAVIGCATCWGAVLLAWLGGSHDLLRGRPFPAGVL